jgi:hypothetical protein
LRISGKFALKPFRTLHRNETLKVIPITFFEKLPKKAFFLSPSVTRVGRRKGLMRIRRKEEDVSDIEAPPL